MSDEEKQRIAVRLELVKMLYADFSRVKLAPSYDEDRMRIFFESILECTDELEKIVLRANSLQE